MWHLHLPMHINIVWRRWHMMQSLPMMEGQELPSHTRKHLCIMHIMH